jgi:hypothetical protein
VSALAYRLERLLRWRAEIIANVFRLEDRGRLEDAELRCHACARVERQIHQLLNAHPQLSEMTWRAA